MKGLEKNLGRFGSRLGLERISRILDAWGNPHKKMHVILVTGTNGKGSVTSYLSSILIAAGKKTGSFYSPHVVRYNERIRINNRPITDSVFKKYEKEALALYKKGLEITVFEALTAIAYKYFYDENVELAVMEIGMGGSFDATNVACAEMSIITNVELEHTEYLGNSIGEIAADKAGIIKRGVCITGTTGEALAMVRAAAVRNNAKLLTLGTDFFVEPKNCSVEGNEFNFIGKRFYNRLRTSLLGRHQMDNAALAVAAAEELDMEDGAIRNGLMKAKNHGRLEIIGRTPLVVADAAHNPAGIGTLMSAIDELFCYEKLFVVFGVKKTKDWKGMLRLIEKHADYIVLTKAKDKDAEEPVKLVENTSGTVESTIAKDVKTALAIARRMAGKKDMLLVCGSICLLGEVLNRRPAMR